jgi:hypothetical protein
MQIDARTVRRAALSSGLLVTIACAAQSAPALAKPAPAATSDAGDARGRAVLKAQLAALADDESFAATFAAKATILTPSGANEVHEPDSGIGSIASLTPHAEVKSATFDHFTSGSVGQLTWFAADLHITVSSHEPESPQSLDHLTVHAIELLDGTAGWKVAVAAFTSVGKMHDQGTSYIRDKDVTPVGPLTKLLTSPSEIAGALGDGVVIYGTDANERAIGAKDAKTQLARWKSLTISLGTPPKAHEVRGATYGYAMANVQVTTKPGGTKYLLNAFLLALPSPDGKWSVIGASYGAL